MLSIEASKLHAVASALFMAVGTPEDITSEVVDILIESNLTGHDSHGVQLIPGYMKLAQKGAVVATARPRIVEETATTALVSGNWGWGQYTAAYGTNLGIEKAKVTKIAAIAMVECNHVGRLGEYSERASRSDMAMIATLGSAGSADGPSGSTAPFGGRKGVLGTNPFSFGIPTGEEPDVLLDFATTVVAGNKVAVARAKGVQLPPGALLDKDGNPSTDPADLANGGVMLPFGGHKGYALAVCAELLGNVVAPVYKFRGPGRYGGTFFVVFDPMMFATPAEYGAATDVVVRRIREVPPAPGFDEVMLPGGPENKSRVERGAQGVPVPEATWDALITTGNGLGLRVESI